jgi:hypothetical protein
VDNINLFQIITILAFFMLLPVSTLIEGAPRLVTPEGLAAIVGADYECGSLLENVYFSVLYVYFVSAGAGADRWCAAPGDARGPRRHRACWLSFCSVGRRHRGC